LQQLGYLIAYEARKIIKIEAVTTQSGAWWKWILDKYTMLQI
jgi:hypothetical protein